MLGEVVYEGRGQRIGMRVLKNGNWETSWFMQGMFLGEKFSATWTSEGEPRPDGTMGMEFWGFFNTETGAMGRYKGAGNVVLKLDGSMVARGSVEYSNPPGKYAKFNGISVVWEFEMDKDGNIHNKGWEWK
jgi:hypothetical protein